MSVTTLFPAPVGAMFLTGAEGFRGRATSAAQAFAREGAPYVHCGLYVGGGKIIQAEQGAGVRERDFAEAYGHRDVLWSDAVIQRHLATEQFVVPGAEGRLRDSVVEIATDLIGSPYGWSNYITVAAAEWRIPGWQLLHRWSVEHGRIICSTLVVLAYRLAGIPLFEDQAVVTPGDLFRLDEAWARTRLADLESRVTAIEDRIA